MSDYLERLLDAARQRVAHARGEESDAAIRARAEQTVDPPSFGAALSGEGVAIIAEIKRRSPSKGQLAPDIVADVLGATYRDAGAAAISVLTDPDGFDGSLEDLVAVSRLGVPTLRKDFVIDDYQVWEARAAGASAVLLIAAALGAQRLHTLAEAVRAAGLAALVEVHDEDELALAHDAGADIVGVNARDLRDFTIDREAFARLRPQVPADVLVIAESGIRTADDVRRHRAWGADAVLVGESLVTAPDPGVALRALVTAGSAPDAASAACP